MRFSICIPTYNRADQLPMLLDSIAAQEGHTLDLEVVVSDNASTDDTACVMGEYQAILPGLTYRRSDENIGPDRNFLRAITLASGEYCWLFGSDDKMEPGALCHVEAVLRANPDLVGATVAAKGYAHDLVTPIYSPDPISSRFTDDTLMQSAEDVVDIIGPALGYISSLVIRRELWNQVVASTKVADYLNSYIHIFVVLKMLQIGGGKWMYVAKRLVGWRSGGDSFSTGGSYKRMQIDVLGYKKIFGDIFGQRSRSYHEAMARVGSQYVNMHIRSALLQSEPFAYWVKAIPLTVSTYWRYPQFWMKTAPFFLVPSPAMRLVRWVYRRTLKDKRARKAHS